MFSLPLLVSSLHSICPFREQVAVSSAPNYVFPDASPLWHIAPLYRHLPPVPSELTLHFPDSSVFPAAERANCMYHAVIRRTLRTLTRPELTASDVKVWRVRGAAESGEW